MKVFGGTSLRRWGLMGQANMLSTLAFHRNSSTITAMSFKNNHNNSDTDFLSSSSSYRRFSTRQIGGSPLNADFHRRMRLLGAVRIFSCSQSEGQKRTFSRKPPTAFKPNQGSGDKGTSMLFTSERRQKDDRVFEALGAVDELAAHVGLIREQLLLVENKAELLSPLCERLRTIQSRLMDVGSQVATPLSSANEAMIKRTEMDGGLPKELESWTQELTDQLEPLSTFILPGGSVRASQVHIARTVCRRAERRLIPLLLAEEIPPVSVQYMNRLSDYLFQLGRWITSNVDKRSDIPYKKSKSS